MFQWAQTFTRNLIAKLGERFLEAPVWKSLEKLRPDLWRSPDMPVGIISPLSALLGVDTNDVEEEWLRIRAAVQGSLQSLAGFEIASKTFRFEHLVPALMLQPAGPLRQLLATSTIAIFGITRSSNAT